MGTGPGDPVMIGDQETNLEFGHPERSSGGDDARIPLRIVARGVDVRTVVEIEAWSGGVQSLVDFFGDLSSSWRGWTGPKEWSDDGPGVAFSAMHDNIGAVKLDVMAESDGGWDGVGSWTVTVRVPIEPGALERIATDLAHLLAGPSSDREKS